MRVLLINSVCGIGSTGRICGELAEELASQGHTVKVAYGRSDNVPELYEQYALRIGNVASVGAHVLYTRLTDRHGLASRGTTRLFLKEAEKFDPDLLWIHNLHGYYINYELLFDWIKNRPTMQVKWTLHDCWAFTGHCVHFTAAGCDKWKTGCNDCTLKGDYPKSIFWDNSRGNYERKKRAFQNVPDMTIVVPSHWLGRLVRNSFLGMYPVNVVANKVDASVFRPTPGDFRKRYGLEKKKIILGVANIWTKRKGLVDFYELAGRLDETYRIVLVGLTKKQQQKLKPNMIGIERTEDTRELAEIYTAADVFVNPSDEETFGMTGLEAAMCGTKSVCYRGTACEEVAMQYGGIAIERDPDILYQTVKSIVEDNER